MPYHLRHATSDDLVALKILADAHRRELGFVHRAALAQDIGKRWVLVACSAIKAAEVVGFIFMRGKIPASGQLFDVQPTLTERHTHVPSWSLCPGSPLLG
jgi:hypothetical protein